MFQLIKKKLQSSNFRGYGTRYGNSIYRNMKFFVNSLNTWKIRYLLKLKYPYYGGSFTSHCKIPAKSKKKNSGATGQDAVRKCSQKCVQMLFIIADFVYHSESYIYLIYFCLCWLFLDGMGEIKKAQLLGLLGKNLPVWLTSFFFTLTYERNCNTDIVSNWNKTAEIILYFISRLTSFCKWNEIVTWLY